MSIPLPPGLMVSVSGIRGRVGETMTPEVTVAVTTAFGAFLAGGLAGRRPRVVLARDSRTSGPMFVRAATAALQSVGCDVIDLGLVPTPTALLAIRHHQADGGLIVTASHNPVEWNALKLASRTGMFLDAEEGARMRAFLADDLLPRAGWDAIGDVMLDDAAVERHMRAVLGIPYIDVAGLRARRFRVVLDAVRGAGGVILPQLLEKLGCTVIGINLEPDGRFPREPEPLAENLGELEAAVRDQGADLGMAVDPDADRLALVAGNGKAIGEDMTLAFAVALVLRHVRGCVVTNLSTSRILDDMADKAGVPLIRAPVGEINVAARMLAEGAVVGGEGNGGVILPDVHLTRDASVAAVLALQLLLETGRSVEEEVASWPRYVILKEKVPAAPIPLEFISSSVQKRLGPATVDMQDGVRFDWPHRARWLHLRSSGTEPVMRIIAEAREEAETRELIREARLALDNAGAHLSGA